MNLDAEQSQRVAALFALGVLVFSWPVMALFNLPGRWLGVPVLYLWLFGCWIALIAAVAWIVERHRSQRG